MKKTFLFYMKSGSVIEIKASNINVTIENNKITNITFKGIKTLYIDLEQIECVIWK